MTILQAVFLGLVQGIAKFLPISSSRHLNLMQALFHMDIEQPLLFNILLHVGTLFAVAVVYWKDWIEMLLHLIHNKTLMLLFIASLPALTTKILLDEPLVWTNTHNALLGWCFLATGLILLLTQRMSSCRNEMRRKESVGIREALAWVVCGRSVCCRESAAATAQ